MVQEKLEEAVWPESKNLVHDMVRNKEIDTWQYAAMIVFFFVFCIFNGLAAEKL